jgi:hypothetical protein
MKLIGRIVCLFKGHRRGVALLPTDPPHVPGDQNVKRFRCPRCGRETRYKVKDQSKGTPGDES